MLPQLGELLADCCYSADPVPGWHSSQWRCAASQWLGSGSALVQLEIELQATSWGLDREVVIQLRSKNANLIIRATSASLFIVNTEYH